MNIRKDPAHLFVEYATVANTSSRVLKDTNEEEVM
jgi:hypothetical protein